LDTACLLTFRGSTQSNPSSFNPHSAPSTVTDQKSH
jgi:hypothetical protein